MTLTFVSNYINHHQLPFCDAMARLLGDGFIFLQTMAMEGERRAMGWGDDGEGRPYMRFSYQGQAAAAETAAGTAPWIAMIAECDILLAGWVEDGKIEKTIQERVMAGKPTFRISERIYKTGRWKVVSPRGLIRNFRERTRHRRRPYFLLCAGAHVAGDYRLIGAFPDKKYRWGYFPATVTHGEELWRKKETIATNGILHLCWAGRFIPWKHPEQMLRLARDLRDGGRPVFLHMVGGGEMDAKLRRLAAAYRLGEAVAFHGPCPPERVREIMDASHIHVFTSDRLEGWGVVLNEAMNSGLAAVANSEAGATGFLIEDGGNGLVYHRGDYRRMRDMVERLYDDADLRKRLAREAYQTVHGLWNAERAAAELVRVSGELLATGSFTPAGEGPLSILRR